MKTVKEMMSELRRIVVRFFVAIRNRVKYDISKYLKVALIIAVAGLLIAVDLLNILVAVVIGFLLGYFYLTVADLLYLIVAAAIGLLLVFTYTTVVDCLNIAEQALTTSITRLILYLPILVILLRDKFLKYRKLSLLGAGILGLGLATGVLILINKSDSNSCAALYDIVTFIKEYKVLVSSITILTLGLPTFFILWMFRTHDTQENINNSTFFECARLLATKDSTEDPTKNSMARDKNQIENSLPKKIALIQLAYLRRETSFDKKKIDSLTKNLYLYNKELSYAQLSGIDLSGANLARAILFNTDLSNANLSRATLNIDVDLREADLRGTDLSNANLAGAKLKKTLYNGKTIFTGTWLDDENERIKEGMIKVD